MLPYRAFSTMLAASLLILSLPAYPAKNTEKYAAVITFSNAEDAKWIVNSAYSTVFQLEKTLNELNMLALKSLDSGYFYEDQKFQLKKINIDQTLAKSNISLKLFGDQQVTIDIRDDGNNNQKLYNIPSMQFSELNLNNDNLMTADDSINAINHIQEALNTLSDILRQTPPKKESWLNNRSFIAPSISTLKIKNTVGAKAWITALDNVFHGISKKIHTMNRLAHKAAEDKTSNNERFVLNDQFQRIKEELQSNFRTGFSLNYKKIFDDNELTFDLNGEKREYYFPSLSVAIFRLDSDFLLDFSSSFKSYNDIKKAKEWIRDWSITGHEIFRPIKDKDRVEVLDNF